MSSGPHQIPASGYPRKPLTKAQLRKMQEQFAKSGEIIEQVKAKEASEKGQESQSADDVVDGVNGWL